MTVEEAYLEIEKLPDVVVHLKMFKPGDWSAWADHAEIGGDGCLSGTGGHAPTAEGAIWALWKQLRDLPANRYIVIGAYTPERRHYRWGGGDPSVAEARDAARWIEVPR